MALTMVNGVWAASCSGAATTQDLSDRSWIRSNAMIFGAVDGLGVYRLRLRSNRLEPIGAHAGASVDDFRMSADRSKLFYQLSYPDDRSDHWIYDIRTGREIKLEAVAKNMKPWDQLAYSADGGRVAWVPRPGDGQTVSIMELRTGRVHAYSLPNPTPDNDTLMFGATWSKDGTEVLVGRRWNHREDFWSIDARSGERRSVQGRRVGGHDDPMDESIHYYRNGADVGHDCILCGRPRGVDAVNLANGARAHITPKDDLVVEKPGAPSLIVAKAEAAEPVAAPGGGMVISACGGVRVGLMAAFDGRYIVYVRNGAYWVYGVAERRRAPLPGRYFAW